MCPRWLLAPRLGQGHFQLKCALRPENVCILIKLPIIRVLSSKIFPLQSSLQYFAPDLGLSSLTGDCALFGGEFSYQTNLNPLSLSNHTSRILVHQASDSIAFKFSDCELSWCVMVLFCVFWRWQKIFRLCWGKILFQGFFAGSPFSLNDIEDTTVSFNVISTHVSRINIWIRAGNEFNKGSVV